MRILVTGGAGFIGSHVVDAYLEAGHEVWALDDLSRGKRERVNHQARFVQMELRSPDLRKFLADGSFDCVNHHAAQMDVRVSVADPGRDATINILGSLNLLEAIRTLGIPRVIFASTGGAIYGDQHHFPANEEHPTAPQSPYGVAKLSVEHYLEYYRQIHGLRYAALRYANVYGPRQDPHGEAGVVAIFCGRILDGNRLVIYGDGEQTRDYVCVKDVARANLLALKYLTEIGETMESVEALESVGSKSSPCFRLGNSTTRQFKNVFNIGTGIETSVNSLAAMLLDGAHVNVPIDHQPARPGEQARSCINPTRAREILGWEPTLPPADGLRATLAWFKAQRAEPVAMT